MNTAHAPVAFDKAHAAGYDQRFAKLAPMKEALHLLLRLLFSEFPAEARILCVGAGTGAELLYLAQAFPQWRFTAVDPSAPMLDICRQRAQVCVTPTHVDLFFRLADLPIEIRRSGLDRDPGWVPAAGRFIAFHFE